MVSSSSFTHFLRLLVLISAAHTYWLLHRMPDHLRLLLSLKATSIFSSICLLSCQSLYGTASRYPLLTQPATANVTNTGSTLMEKIRTFDININQSCSLSLVSNRTCLKAVETYVLGPVTSIWTLKWHERWLMCESWAVSQLSTVRALWQCPAVSIQKHALF